MIIENERTLQIVKEHKKEVAIQIEKINATLENINSQGVNSANDIVQLIHHTLHKASVLAASYILMKQLGESVPFKDTDTFIDILKYLFKLQRKNINKKIGNFTLREIMDNFKFWSPVDRNALYDVLVKEHYLFIVMRKVLLLDRQWMSAIVTLQCDVAIAAQNMVDVNAILEKKASQDDIAVIEKTLGIAVNLCEDAARSCIAIYSRNKKDFSWLAKTFYFLKATKTIAKVQKNEAFIQGIDRRIQRAIRQFNHDAALSGEKITIGEILQKTQI